MPRALALVVATVASVVLGGCGGATVSCENLCQHTQACDVTFHPRDDADGKKIASGERTADQDCVLGCQENPAVTVESARCVDSATAKSTDPDVCQPPVLACLDATAG